MLGRLNPSIHRRALRQHTQRSRGPCCRFFRFEECFSCSRFTTSCNSCMSCSYAAQISSDQFAGSCCRRKTSATRLAFGSFIRTTILHPPLLRQHTIQNPKRSTYLRLLRHTRPLLRL